MNPRENPTVPEQHIDLWKVGELLWRYKLWLTASVVTFTALFAFVAFTMTPVYRAVVVLADTSAERSGLGSISAALGQFGGLASLAGINVGGAGSSAEPIAVLRSREFTEAFIRDRDLMPDLFHKSWDSAGKRWKTSQNNAPTLARGFRTFDKSVRFLSEDRRTGLVTLSIEWKDPVKAADWANSLVARVNDEMRARAIERTNAAIGYLEKELQSTSEVETRQAISRLMEAQIKQRMLANVTIEYAFRVVDRALPPDLRDKIRPKRLAMLVAGAALGAIFGVFGIIFANAVRARRSAG